MRDETVGSDVSELEVSVDARPVNGSATQRSRKSSVRVRLPEEKDWGDMRLLVQKHHARTVFSDIPISERKLDALEKRARNPAPNQCMIVAEAKGQLVGLAWFSAGEYVIGEGVLMTTTHLIAVDAEQCGHYLSAKAFMRLVQGIVIWSNSRNAKHVLVHVTTGTAMKATDRLLRVGGASCIGGGYLIET
jgi:hypothetical protein